MNCPEIDVTVPLPDEIEPATSQPITSFSRRTFLTRSSYSVAALLALSQWDGVGTPPAEARAAFNAPGGKGGRGNLAAGTISRLSLPFWGDGAKWDDAAYWSTMQSGRRQQTRTYNFCDFDGDGREELLIRGPGGIEIVQWHTDNAQWMPFPGDTTALQDFKDENFGQQQYYYTLQVADINGDGRPEIVGRFADGLRVYRYDTGSQVWSRLTTCERFADSQAWGTAQYYYQTIQCGDIDGDGIDEVIARAGGGIIVWKYNPTNGSWSQIAFSDRFPDNAYWTSWQYWVTIQLADVDGDKAKELIARSGTALEIWKFDTTTNTFVYQAGYEGWSDPNNWNVPAQFLTIQCGDLDGDGADEIFGNGILGLEAFKYNATTKTFTLMAPRIADTSTQFGWSASSQYATLQMADIDGDGAKEIIARAGPVGIMAFKIVNGQWIRFAENDINKELSDANGWGDVQYYDTFQSAHVLKPGDADYTGNGTKTQAIVLGRNAVCVVNYRWDKGGNGWKFLERANPDFTGTQLTAYQALDRSLRGFTATGNIRETYNDLVMVPNTFPSWLFAMYNSDAMLGLTYETPPAQRPATLLPLPSGVDTAAWEAVVWQIFWEMQWAKAIQAWWGQTENLINETFLGNSFVLTDVGNYLTLTPSNGTAVALNVISVIGNALWAIAGLPALESGTASAVAGMIGVAAGAAATFAPGSEDTFQGAYSNLQSALGNSFNSMLAQHKRNLNQIVGGKDPNTGAYMPADYGLFRMFGENIVYGIWQFTNNDATVTVAQRGYALGAFQQLISSVGAIREFYLELDVQPPAYSLYKETVSWDNLKYWYRRLSTNVNDMAWFDDSTYTTLFGDVQTGSVFPLGQKMEWLYSNTPTQGWPPLWINADLDGFDTDLVRRPLNPTIKLTPVLTRDAGTGEVILTLIVANRGIRNTTNLALTTVQLGNRTALPHEAARHRFLRSNFPETITMRFPSLAAGLKTTLTIRGAYKGGTFGTRLRVTVP
jgi:hypothetical protein